MTIPRASANLGRTVLRRASAQARSRAWRQIGRRNYASDHGKQSSEIPWMIGSVAFTVPAAVWLLGQAPQKSAHHESSHEEKEPKEEEEQPAEESTEEKSDEGSDEGKQDEGKKDDSDSDESKEDSSEEKSDDDSGDDKSKESDDGSGKGPGEGQKKGERRPAEKKGDKDSQSDASGAKHPYLDDDEKSKKGEGLKETQKIHGTVDSRRPARGDGDK